MLQSRNCRNRHDCLSVLFLPFIARSCAICPNDPPTSASTRAEVLDYIEMAYNCMRRHSHLSCDISEAFERNSSGGNKLGRLARQSKIAVLGWRASSRGRQINSRNVVGFGLGFLGGSANLSGSPPEPSAASCASHGRDPPRHFRKSAQMRSRSSLFWTKH